MEKIVHKAVVSVNRRHILPPGRRRCRKRRRDQRIIRGRVDADRTWYIAVNVSSPICVIVYFGE